MAQILVVEDELGLVEFLRMELELLENDVSVAMTGQEAMSKLQQDSYDCVLLDIMLPDMDGFELCKRVRETSDVPIIMLTARGAIADRVTGLDAGADDYMVKPFSIEELTARIRALSRRQARTQLDSAANVLNTGWISVNLERHKVYFRDQAVDLTVREYELLVHFMRHPNHVFSRDDLLTEVWGYESPVDTNVVDVYVGYLRQKLDPEKRHLKTVRGSGYVFHEAQL